MYINFCHISYFPETKSKAKIGESCHKDILFPAVAPHFSLVFFQDLPPKCIRLPHLAKFVGIYILPTMLTSWENCRKAAGKHVFQSMCCCSTSRQSRCGLRLHLERGDNMMHHCAPLQHCPPPYAVLPHLQYMESVHFGVKRRQAWGWVGRSGLCFFPPLLC